MAVLLPPQIVPIGRTQQTPSVPVDVTYEWRRALEQAIAEIEALKARVAALGG